MLGFLETLKNKHTDDESIQAFNEIENQIREKKYGLVWEEHEESVDRLLKENIPVFIEDEKKKIQITEDAFNFILEGDNLQSLYLLKKTHRGAIDLIYIDPPYNRGKNDFIYDDNIVDNNDVFRHSKWISFMRKRLFIAKALLSDIGCIFISIDDHELYSLKLLCDEIFGEENLIAVMPRISKKAGKNQQPTYASNHDYLICYALNKNRVKFIHQEADSEDYPYTDEYFEERGGYKLNQTLDYDTLGYQDSLDYPITIDGETYYAGQVTEEEYLARKEENPKDGFRWRWSPEMVEYGLQNGFVVVKESENGKRIYTKTYYNAKIEKKAGHYYTDFIDRTVSLTSLEYIQNKYSNDNAKKNIDAFDLGVKFEYSKPVALIKHILTLFPNSITVLDFFAGSGTTAQAVIEQNHIDRGKRKFIICTNNQNDICHKVTYPRVSKTILGYSYTGKKEDTLYEKKLTLRDVKKAETILAEVESIIDDRVSDYNKIVRSFKDGVLKVVGIWDTCYGVEGIPSNLKYYMCDWIPRKPEEYLLTNVLCLHIKEMIELKMGTEIDNIKNILVLNKTDFKTYVYDNTAKDMIQNIWVNQNIVFNSEEMQILSKWEYKYIPKEFFGQEIKEAGE